MSSSSLTTTTAGAVVPSPKISPPLRLLAPMMILFDLLRKD